jgi:trimeric autotransporter adhesin
VSDLAGVAVYKARWVERVRPRLAFWLLALFVLVGLLLMAGTRFAHAATLDVNSTADPGTGGCNSTECTLREAIVVSNGLSTTETIEFSIPGTDSNCNTTTDVCTVSPTSQLPLITDNVTIAGYAQPGAVANTATTNANNAVLKIELNGANTDANASGLAVVGAGARGTRIRGLVINRFGNHGVLVNAPNSIIEGNFIGTNAAGDADLGNSGACAAGEPLQYALCRLRRLAPSSPNSSISGRS